MIKDLSDLPSADPVDAPPEYNESLPASGPISTNRSVEKRPNVPEPVSAGTPPFSSYTLPSSSTTSSSPNWLNPQSWSKPQKAQEIRNTVLPLIRDVAKDASQPTMIDILKSCFFACRAYGVSFEHLIRERSIEGHTPLYWAILSVTQSHQRNLEPEQRYAVLDFLTSFPLSEDAIFDARSACILNSDNETFQRLRQSVYFTPRSYADSIIVGDAVLPPFVTVTHEGPGIGAFSISYTIPKWLPRMRVTKDMYVDFVARGRAWRLRFAIASPSTRVDDIPDGRWFVGLTLLKGSDPTHVHGELIFTSRSVNKDNANVTGGQPAEGDTQGVSLPIHSQSNAYMLEQSVPIGEKKLKELWTRLDSTPDSATLESEGSPYVSSDGGLSIQGRFVLEEWPGTDE